MNEKQKENIRKKIINGTIYKTKKYQQWRKAVFERDRYTCQLSGEVGGNLEAHHILGKYDHPELIYDVDNGVTLSKREHQWLHHCCFEDRYRKRFQELAKANKPRKKIKRTRKTKSKE